jgi:hypothetical protein
MRLCHYLPLDCSRRDSHLLSTRSQPGQRGQAKMQRLLIILGVALLVAGIAWPLLSRIGLGRLPGDIAIQRGNTSFYFPIVTCILISIVFSALVWLFNR